MMTEALVEKSHTETFLMPVLVFILGGASLALVALISYCTCHFYKAKSRKESRYSTPDKDSPETFLSRNVTISQSTPDLIEDIQVATNNNGSGLFTGRLDVLQAEEKIGKSHYKTVVKQSTLPTLPSRHQTFQRQLSHKLDLSNVEFSIQSMKYEEQPQVGKLRPELYRQNAHETPENSSNLPMKQCGRLEYSLQYDQGTETLNVNVLRAFGLPAKDFSGTSDPYVKIYLLPDRKKKYQTRVHRKTLNPEFNENFYFDIAFHDLRDRSLQFTVYDFDRFSRHDLIGVVMLKDLSQVDLSHVHEFSMDILSTQQQKVELGELMLSLCYLPTAGRLTVTIIKARHLKAMDITGNSDPYVKVALMCRGKRIKKKKTTVKKNCLNPVYNEAIVFDVPNENVEEVSIIIKVVDYDRVGSNELMGVCAVGPHYIGVGRDHWFEMLESPRKPVAQWYALQETIPGAHPGSRRTSKQSNKKDSLTSFE